MGRLIDEQTAYDVLTDYYHHTTDTQHAALMEALERVESVDAEPVVHGRWVRVYSRPGVFKYLGWTCDQCGQRTGNEYAPQWYKFCPNCGARMDGDGNG